MTTRTNAMVTRALALAPEHGVTGAWLLVEAEFAHVAPASRKLAFTIFARLAVKH